MDEPLDHERIESPVARGGCPNLLGPNEHEQIAHAYRPNATRLRAVKTRFDPDRVFSAIPRQPTTPILSAVDRRTVPKEAVTMNNPVDVASVLQSFEDLWSPRTVATLNDYDIRVVKTKGEFTRHTHPDTDEFFLVLRGSLTIRMDTGDVELGPGQLFVVPRGVRHQPVSVEGAEVMLIEPSSTVNTGDTPSVLTSERHVVEPRLNEAGVRDLPS
jgi:mannose-6-phosphate isomerase-like protein (cupin superfamily)